jgi:hypothetical protein
VDIWSKPKRAVRGQVCRTRGIQEYSWQRLFILGEDKKSPPKLIYWTCYAKSTAIEVINKEANNSVFTLFRTKKLVLLFHYKYEEHADDDEHAGEAAAAIWSG